MERARLRSLTPVVPVAPNRRPASRQYSALAHLLGVSGEAAVE